jgi:hypothetical protein
LTLSAEALVALGAELRLLDATGQAGIGTEFGGPNELYERNYTGGWGDIRAQSFAGAERGGDLAAMKKLVDQCMADYDENGWIGDTWILPTDVVLENRRGAHYTARRRGGSLCRLVLVATTLKAFETSNAKFGCGGNGSRM